MAFKNYLVTNTWVEINELHWRKDKEILHVIIYVYSDDRKTNFLFEQNLDYTVSEDDLKLDNIIKVAEGKMAADNKFKDSTKI